MLFVCHPKILHKHCLQFRLGVKMAPRETKKKSLRKIFGWETKSIMMWYSIFCSAQWCWNALKPPLSNMVQWCWISGVSRMVLCLFVFVSALTHFVKWDLQVAYLPWWKYRVKCCCWVETAHCRFIQHYAKKFAVSLVYYRFIASM